MAKFIAEKYRTVGTGDIKVCAYHIVIKKQVVEETGLQDESELYIHAKNGKIIIEKKKER